MDRIDALLKGRGRHYRARLAAGIGFTLVEAMISLAVLSAVMLGISSFMMTQSRIQIEEETATGIQTHLRRTLNELAFELEESRPVLITTDGRQYGYCMPLKQANGSLILDGPEADSQFGVPDKVSSANWQSAVYDKDDSAKRNNYFILAFRPRVIVDSGTPVRPAPQDPRQILNENDLNQDFDGDGDEEDVIEGFAESVIGQDLNEDGDLSDVYVYGNMEQIRMDTGTVRWTGGKFAIPFGGKVFSVEAETVTPPYANPEKTQYSIYDRVSNSIDDTNNNLKWDASILIMVWFLELREEAVRLKVSRTKVTLRNTL